MSCRVSRTIFRDFAPSSEAKQFERLSRAYLADCPSISFTLRNLGSQLEAWLRLNPRWISGNERLALDMVRLEWAHIEAFDGAARPVLTPAEIELAGLSLRVGLQPYVRLLELAYPADDLLIELRQYEGDVGTATNAARLGQLRRRVRRYAMPEPEPIYLAAHRFEDSVYYKRLQRESYRMLWSLGAHRTLEQAIDDAFEGSDMPDEERLTSLQQWFANWAELGWFCAPDA